jgi:peptide deformylase
MIRTILHHPDPRLRVKAEPVPEVTPEILRLIGDMAETMYAGHGVGLAATQIGEPVRIFILHIATLTKDAPTRLMVFINPEVSERTGTQTGTEGCLSLPGRKQNVTRAQRVTIQAMGRDVKTFKRTVSGFLAKAIQHELDHLDGVLMIDHEPQPV